MRLLSQVACRSRACDRCTWFVYHNSASQAGGPVNVGLEMIEKELKAFNHNFLMVSRHNTGLASVYSACQNLPGFLGGLGSAHLAVALLDSAVEVKISIIVAIIKKIYQNLFFT